ncbi:response regulator [Marinobacterium lacunae]|uniref:response regulator n=1 Tax=Marinobacterium lacunae TaxID=1232683 RepID=UPI0018CC545F|nr:response regulator [Marinobacterium lacunae]
MGTRILIIDDERAIREMFALYLKSQGYEVETSGDGEEALAMCERDLPALVMCDLRMPGRMDGLDVLARLRVRFEDLPVIVVSGTGDMDDAIKALQLGAWDFLTKPLPDLEVMKHAVERMLERSRLLRENKDYRLHLEEANDYLELSLARRREDEAAGRRIQFALMPPAKRQFGQFQCSHHIQSSSLLSGDFIDYFSIDRDRFGFYMIDVSGHGVSSALITVLVKSQVSRFLEDFRRYRDATILDPSALLKALNRSLLENEYGKYLTIFYGIIDERKSTLTYSIGGHFPYPYCFDGDAVLQVGDKSPPVGLFEDAEHRSAKHRIGDHFALRLFSDGVLETMSELSLNECKEVLRNLSARGELDAPELANEIGVLGLDSPIDDASILSIRRVSANG